MKRLALLALLLLISGAHAASFDCHKAVTKVEKAICSDPELSRLDGEMGAAYRAALKDKPNAAITRQLQQGWLKKRKYCEYSSDADCLKKQYQMQLALLRLPVITVPAGKPLEIRAGQSATLLRSGKVLIAGGYVPDVTSSESLLKNAEFTSLLGSAELYDPATGKFSAAGSRTEPGPNSSVLLPSGKVLLVGGGEWVPSYPGKADEYACNGSADIYDPATGRFTHTGDDNTLDQRYVSSLSLLPNGKVLIVNESGNLLTSDYTVLLTLYDPATGKYSDAGNSSVDPGTYQCMPGSTSTTALKDGKVMVYGGGMEEVFDPATGEVGVADELPTKRFGHTATLLKNGRVLLAGGADSDGKRYASAEQDDPEGAVTATGNLNFARASHTATLLKNGKVLIAGGEDDAGNPVAAVELYDPAKGTFSVIGRLAEPGDKTATLLKNGKVLFVGGGTAELYDPAARR